MSKRIDGIYLLNPDSIRLETNHYNSYFIDFRWPLKKTPRNVDRERTESETFREQLAGWKLYGLIIEPRNDPTQYIL